MPMVATSTITRGAVEQPADHDQLDDRAEERCPSARPMTAASQNGTSVLRDQQGEDAGADEADVGRRRS